ncbi:MAG: M3 family metallopeptidase, partial [Bacteroidales bacterium]|nr:M3 family metallopeptidase [Candidatus Colimorpha onthohippi]
SIYMDNILLHPWLTPHQTPPFGDIDTSMYLPAIDTAIKTAQSRIDAITANSDSPSFSNTIVALEEASQELNRITSLLFNLNECDTSPELEEIVMSAIPKLSQFENGISMNQKLFERVEQVYKHRENGCCTTSQQLMLLEKTYKQFVRNGAALPEAQRKRLADINEQLSLLSQEFNKHVLSDNNAFMLHLTQASDLQGLPDNHIKAARQEAEQRGLDGWVVSLSAPSYTPFMTYARNRQLRERLWRAYNSRGCHAGSDTDNRSLIRQITALRAEKARLLGYDCYCDYVLSERMVQSTTRLNDFMRQLIDAALPAAKQDVDDVNQLAHSNEIATDLKLNANEVLEPWDYSFYSELLRQQSYQFDTELIRPYLELNQVKKGIFDLYHTLYGLQFIQATNIATYHPEVTVYEVYDQQRLMGVLYLDLHPRPSKRSGAWMTEFRGQWRNGDNEVRPLIQVVCNFSRPIGDSPALLSFSELKTFMHEMGHAIHGLLSDVDYESLSGTNVYRDFVELPSHLMENWCYEPLFLSSFARHYRTGEALPINYIEKIKQAQAFQSGYLCVRQINYGLIDIAFHSICQPIDDDIEGFEHEAIIEQMPWIAGCFSSPAFTHIFSGGYASGYYGYKWAEVLEADIFSRFHADGILNSVTAQRLRTSILSRGGTEHPANLFRNFMGRDPDISAFMIRSGFANSK